MRDLAGSFDTMAGRLETLVASQREFAADASHQLRTPLAALRLRLENLREGADAGSHRDVDAALVEVERLAGIIDGLLVLARAESPEPTLVAVAVAEVVRDRVSAHEVLAARQGVTLSGRSERVSATAVLGAVDQMLDNLIDNAVKASPRGSEVTVRAAVTPGGVEIHVVDQGPGMSDEERRHAFERFWRSGATGRGGSGLGLAIVDRLARASGGARSCGPPRTAGSMRSSPFPRRRRRTATMLRPAQRPAFSPSRPRPRLPPVRARSLIAALAGAAAVATAIPSPAPAEGLTGVVGQMTCVAPTDAAGLDAMLTRAGSPLAGEGAAFVSEGLAAGVDPRALVAIAAHETMLETYLPAQTIRNPFGLGPGMAFARESDAIALAARTLGDNYLPEGRDTLATIGAKGPRSERPTTPPG